MRPRCLAYFIVASLSMLMASPGVLCASAEEAGGGVLSIIDAKLDQPVRDRLGAVIGNLADILLAPRGGHLVAVIQVPAAQYPIALPFTDLNFANGNASLAMSAVEFEKAPKGLIVASAGIQSKRLGKLPPNVGLMAVASLSARDFQIAPGPNVGEGGIPSFDAGTNLSTGFANAPSPRFGVEGYSAGRNNSLDIWNKSLLAK